MTETALVEEIKKRASNLNRRSTMWAYFHRVNTLLLGVLMALA